MLSLCRHENIQVQVNKGISASEPQNYHPQYSDAYFRILTIRQRMLTISHITVIDSAIALVFAFYVGATTKSVKPSFVIFPLLLSLGLAIVVAVSTMFMVYPICEKLKLCAPTHDMNIFHPLIPVVWFPIFWLPYLLGLAGRPNKNV
jgi:hypothetical protein